MGLTSEAKLRLLAIARRSVESAVRKERPPDLAGEPEELRELRGAFVTLKIHGSLRGCIGYIEPVKSLAEAVSDVAEKAALEDPRFPPVTRAELGEIEIDVSALTPRELMKSPDEIEIGKHGLIVELGYSRGLLLPQVATEYGWDREEFLAQTCWKAGLPPEAWKDPRARVYLFSAEVFSDAEIRC